MKTKPIAIMLLASLMLVLISLPAMAAGEMNVTRSFSTQEVVAGETFRVTLDMYTNSDISAPTIDEEIPLGWEIIQVYNDEAVFKQKTLEWMFMTVLNAGCSKSIEYDITVPADTLEGKYSISGTHAGYSIAPSLISGDSEITVTTTTFVPEANFSFNFVQGTTQTVVKFTDLSTGAPFAWKWDFENDGIIDSIEQHPEHIFDESGNYDVQLIVTNAVGDNSTVKTDCIKISDPSGNTTESKSVHSAISLGADIIPDVAIQVSPGTINFGLLGTGDTSDVKTIRMSNKGGDNTIITLDVIDAADDLFIEGLCVDSNIWKDYSTSLDSKEKKTADLTLHVPSDYSNIGSMKGILVVWAEIE
ncbi:PKD domain-containing protein [Methanococcoides sp. SA1]|nr:PKD domain-containing protein [Methanococcoides sp. SA1]